MRGHPMLWLFILSFLAHRASGQPGDAWPVIQPANVQCFDIEAGLPNTCTFNGFVDPVGRLWVNSCFSQTEHRQYDFYQFDGSQAYSVSLPKPNGCSGQAFVKGCLRDGSLFGFLRESDRYFLYNPADQTTVFHALGDINIAIVFIAADTTEQLVIYGSSKTHHYVFRHGLDGPQKLLELPRSRGTNLVDEWHNEAPRVLQGSVLWFFEQPYNERVDVNEWLIRFDTRSRQVDRFRTDSLFQMAHKQGIAFTIYAKGDTLYRLDNDGRLHAMNTNTYQVYASRMLPEFEYPVIKNKSISEDKKGNMLFMYTFRTHPRAILREKNGRTYDYTQVMSTVLARSRYPHSSIKGVWSNDFFQKIICFTEGGIVTADMSQAGSVESCLTENPTRSIAEIGPDEFYIMREPSMFLYIRSANACDSEPLSFTCPSIDGKYGIHDLKVDRAGHTWYPFAGYFLEIDRNKHCELHPTGKNFTRFEILTDSTMVVCDDRLLYTYNFNTEAIAPLLQDDKVILDPPVNQIYRAQDGTLWIATFRGLWHVNMETGESRCYRMQDGLQDEAVLCIHEDDQGRFWIGTYNAGLQILDPDTGGFRTIDATAGLSNNTVVGILPDDEGVLWVATFNGITLVSPDGEVLSQMYAEDGLTTNEFNRYSYLKDNQGRLIFGSVRGLNVIDPAPIKERLLAKETPAIYFTSIVSYDRELRHDAEHLVQYRREGVIRLPAIKRYLKLKFALSSYIRPEDQQFSYKVSGLQGQGEEWASIGSTNELNLYGLPSGTFDILIKGADYRGNQSPEPLILHIVAEELFYKQMWFYVALILLISGIGIFWLLRERAERKKLELIVAQRTSKILEDKEIIERQAEKLMELDIAKTRLFTNISHEFRTPLTVIQGMADHVATDPSAPELIKRNTKSLLDLVNQMLDLRKIESGALKLELRSGDFIRFVRYIADSYNGLALTKGLDFQLNTSVDSLMMTYDQEKVRQILVNLLSNAIKFTDHGRVSLDVDLLRDGSHVQLRVADTGKGIPQDNLEEIFNRYYQVEGTMGSEGGGTGIGLTLASELVKLMDGKIEVESTYGSGTMFTVTLPVLPVSEGVAVMDHQDNTPDITGPQEVYKQDKSNGSRPHVLIVEDSSDVIHFLVASLKGAFKVSVATNGEEGIRKALEEVPDLVVSDVMMPVKDGFELCETLKQDERTSHIPIVLLTAKADNASRIVGLRRGADVYLAKPFQGNVLLAQLESLLASRERMRSRYKATTTPAPSPDPGLQIEDAFIARLRDFIESRIEDEHLQVPDICDGIGMSRANLHRKLVSITGKPVTSFIRMVRLQKAREILRTQDVTVSQVAFMVGFNYPETFSRAFQEEFGESPSAWKAKA